MKTKMLFVVFAIVASPTRPAHAGSLTELQDWKGKPSFERIGGRTFWQVDAFNEALSEVLTPRELSDFRKVQGPETPVEVAPPYVYATICEAHNCGNHQYSFFVDTDRDHVWVCYTTDQLADQGAVVWAASGHRRVRAQSCDPEVDSEGNASFRARLAMIPKSLR